MNSLNEQQLEQLLNQPLPSLQPDEFRRDAYEQFCKQQQNRSRVLQLFTMLALACLCYVIPATFVDQAMILFSIMDLSSTKYMLASAMPILMLMIVGYFLLDS